jgi:hypothetical protein
VLGAKDLKFEQPQFTLEPKNTFKKIQIFEIYAFENSYFAQEKDNSCVKHGEHKELWGSIDCGGQAPL